MTEPTREIVIKYNNLGAKAVCAICNEWCESHVGAQLFIEGTWDVERARIAPTHCSSEETAVTPAEAHNVIGSIQGVPEPASWAEDGHTSQVNVCVEMFEGERLAYVMGLTETGRTVRVDLDEEGWFELRRLATEVWMRIKTARLMDEKESP